ncbi:hypothetical protein [Lapidilactobacillus bayanensis]|uniref:hypothetical protein n=1 Tax=Lapidilactobacillus bayanensis TaxID=2485998 RepID=UPI000F781951|nr:hypothetical protein [Lapidilactobacillus bayanensis]
MAAQVKNFKIGNYYIRFNNFLERFLIFDNVFHEFAETSERIEIGDCLVAETLPALKEDWLRNFGAFKHFIDHEVPQLADKHYQEFQKKIAAALTKYGVGQYYLLSAIDSEHNRINHAQARVAEQYIRNCKIELNQYLQQISTVSFG